MKKKEELAAKYAGKHSGLGNPKDPRFRRYYLAFLAGWDAAKEMATREWDRIDGPGSEASEYSSILAQLGEEDAHE